MVPCFHALPQPDIDRLKRAATRTEPLLQVQGLLLQPKKVRPRNAISFELRRGASLALVGEDGSGRRGLARAILGLDRRPGRVLFDAVDLNLLSEVMTAVPVRAAARRLCYQRRCRARSAHDVMDGIDELLRAHPGSRAS